MKIGTGDLEGGRCGVVGGKDASPERSESQGLLDYDPFVSWGEVLLRRGAFGGFGRGRGGRELDFLARCTWLGSGGFVVDWIVLKRVSTTSRALRKDFRQAHILGRVICVSFPLPGCFGLALDMVNQTVQIFGTAVYILPDELIRIRGGPSIAAATTDENLAVVS